VNNILYSKQLNSPFLHLQSLVKIRLAVAEHLNELFQSLNHLVVVTNVLVTLTNVPLVMGFLFGKLVLQLKLFV